MTKFILILFFLVGCGEYGCIDENACNYDPDAILTDSTSCLYAFDNYDCDGDCLLNLDCNDECGGSATVDECGECGGDGPDENFDCDGDCLVSIDCNDECGGDDSTCIDECGVLYGEDTYIDGFCQDDLDFLIDLVDTNISLNGEAPLEIGYQNWINSRLTSLTIGSNQITYIPESIENLTYLTGLDFGGNSIGDLPEELFNLVLLSYLKLNNNQITNISSSIGNLTNLDYLYLNYNDITTLPDEIGNLLDLDHLSLNNNQLTSLPESIGDLSDLNSLYLNSNELTELPNSFCDLNATYINLQYNNLCDEYDYNYCINIIFGYEDQSNCCDGDNGIPNWTQCED